MNWVLPEAGGGRRDLDGGRRGRRRDGVVGAAGGEVLQHAAQVQSVEQPRRHGHHRHHLRKTGHFTYAFKYMGPLKVKFTLC